MAVDYRAQVRTDVRAFIAGGAAAVAGVVCLVLWRLEVLSAANGATAAVVFGGLAVGIGVVTLLVGPLIYDRAFVVAPAGLGIVPLAVGIGSRGSPLVAFVVSMAIAVVSTGAFFALRRSRRA